MEPGDPSRLGQFITEINNDPPSDAVDTG